MKPQKIYAEVLEQSALDQFNAAMANEHVVKGALLPDAHTGYTLPIGAVVAVKDHVFSSFVGFDIGCGMCAIKTSFNKQDIQKNSEDIMKQIYKDLPVGFNHQAIALEKMNTSNLSPAAQAIYSKKDGDTQLGTLGGGNHFVEIGYDEDDNVWTIVHSGSRGVGHGIAHFYMCLASPTNKASEGFYPFAVDSFAGRDYINDLNWTLKYALRNRELILQEVVQSIRAYVVGGPVSGTLINRNHNHAELKDGLWIHRKGATHAEKGMMGVIPGNMLDGSFIVEGLGNSDSLCSSSHGAGRVMGRKKAKETLDYNEFVDSMEGVTCRISKDLLDEAPKSYKNIFDVMELQKDLVSVKHHIRPIINIKAIG